MPELPEVEAARALIDARALGRQITAVDDADTYVCRPHAPGELAAALTGRTLTAAKRIGKSMWCETDGGVRLGLHLGMAGRILVDGSSAGDPVGPGEDDRAHVDPRLTEHPEWGRFTLDFADGGHLVLFDKRRLGRAVLDPDLSHLGPDAALVGKDEFRARVGRGDAPLKARIMDQSVIAGVGNLLADEALWRARLSPNVAAGSLSEEELDLLRREIRATTRSALKKGGVHTGRLIPHRERGGTCPRCGATLGRASVGGRTTYWCTAEQQD
ncbi:Fpg/Nei family DNA glycosylase [Conexibacter sp. SYSU D00693]|uniref:Fpg/Nei family DNA glycosylase n=1 Tax=Conexibacter sp. SYSU D00693 TaxID=2812560 RepID=UPI00196A4D9F|nr:DNA-formamidopyrimidine glycosylase family protein [Conexibacter sp. SYSU D00693]